MKFVPNQKEAELTELPIPTVLLHRSKLEEAFKGPIDISLFGVHSFQTYFNWGQEKIGFGQFSLGVKNEDDHVCISADTEGMGLEWTRRALHTLVDKIMDQFPEDSDRYNPVVKIPYPQELLDARQRFEQDLTAAEAAAEEEKPE